MRSKNTEKSVIAKKSTKYT